MPKYPFFFDYIFYRVARAYFKLDGKHGATGIAAVVIIQYGILTCIMFLVSRVSRHLQIRQITAINGNSVGVATVVIGFILAVITIVRYDGKYVRLKSHWKSETASEQLGKAILVFLSIIAPWIMVLLLGLNIV